ncbi:MAG: 4Fe-4S dicluster domain-containing protein, partial [Magnetococcales bacterium]|nr:4Fe-4S dicluster domain-containing protein [Magnetococcales bacterium]
SAPLMESGVRHEENQPPHLLIDDEPRLLDEGKRFGHPQIRYCPAGVYEIAAEPVGDTARLRLHPSHCLHCKTCDIKDPTGLIRWTPPEGGGGPDHGAM